MYFLQGVNQCYKIALRYTTILPGPDCPCTNSQSVKERLHTARRTYSKLSKTCMCPIWTKHCAC